MMYNNYLITVAQRFESLFTEIAAEYGFDYGNEFEVILCRALRAILPQKYGVCRGYVVSEDNQTAGDDIIIYDQELFSSLRLLPQNNYEVRNYIPIEAVYAYIEAKYTLNINGKGGQSLSKALSQILKAKKVISKRKERLPIQFDTYKSLSNKFYITKGEEWPKRDNCAYGAIISLGVRDKEGKSPINDARQIKELLVDRRFDDDYPPDLVIAGNGVVVLPMSNNSTTDNVIINSPFYVEGKTSLLVRVVENHAFAVGICSLLWAIDTIRLNPLPWGKILIEGLNYPTEFRESTLGAVQQRINLMSEEGQQDLLERLIRQLKVESVSTDGKITYRSQPNNPRAE
jgi:hypothetical protein